MDDLAEVIQRGCPYIKLKSLGWSATKLLDLEVEQWRKSAKETMEESSVKKEIGGCCDSKARRREYFQKDRW